MSHIVYQNFVFTPEEFNINKASPTSDTTVKLWSCYFYAVPSLGGQARIPPRDDRPHMCHSRKKAKETSPCLFEASDCWNGRASSDPCCQWLWVRLPVASWDPCFTAMITMFLYFTIISQHHSIESTERQSQSPNGNHSQRFKRSQICPGVQRQIGRQSLRSKHHKET